MTTCGSWTENRIRSAPTSWASPGGRRAPTWGWPEVAVSSCVRGMGPDPGADRNGNDHQGGEILGSVLVHRKHRGAGVGRQLVSGAMTKMGELGTPLGMLFCRTPRVSFYESLGWRPVDGTVTVDQRPDRW